MSRRELTPEQKVADAARKKAARAAGYRPPEAPTSSRSPRPDAIGALLQTLDAIVRTNAELVSICRTLAGRVLDASSTCPDASSTSSTSGDAFAPAGAPASRFSISSNDLHTLPLPASELEDGKSARDAGHVLDASNVRPDASSTSSTSSKRPPLALNGRAGTHPREDGRHQKKDEVERERERLDALLKNPPRVPRPGLASTQPTKVREVMQAVAGGRR